MQETTVTQKIESPDTPAVDDTGLNQEVHSAIDPTDPESDTLKFISRIGRVAINMPSKIYDKLLYGAVAFQNEPVHMAKRTAQSGLVVFGVSQLDDATRYGVFAKVHTATDGNALMSGLAFGGTAFLTQTAAVLAASSLLETDSAKQTLGRVHNFLRKTTKRKEITEPKDLSMPVQVGIAALGGPAPLIVARQSVNPEMTRRERDGLGLKVSALMAAYLAVEETVVSNFVETYGWPKTMAGLALGVTALGSIYTKMARKGEKTANENAREEFEEWQEEHNKQVHVGIFGEDIDSALLDPRTKTITYKNELGQKITTPVLVPIDKLGWFNDELISGKFDTESEVYLYVHPPRPNEKASVKVSEIISSTLESGAVILTEMYGDDTTSEIAQAVADAYESGYKIERFGTENSPSRVDFFNGHVEVIGSSEARSAPSLIEVYEKAVKEGAIVVDEYNGPSLAQIIEGEEAEQIWDIYEKPFEGLGKDDPAHAGFDHDALMDVLADPSVAKIVNRVDGRISTLLFFVTDFKKVPWFNERYYQKNYPDYYATENVLVFPGIVTDESMQGNSYATDTIDLATSLYTLRGSSVLIAFECTEISTTYIPGLVTAALENSGKMRVSGLDEATDTLNYIAIQKTT